MSDQQNEQRKSGLNASANKPDLLGYSVRPIAGGRKSSWSKVAAAWAHKDGLGFEVRMDAVPVDGRLVLRTAREDNSGDPNVIEQTPKGLE